MIYLIQDKFFPNARSKFAKVPNRRFWERPTYDYLDSVINRIEFKYGRRTPLVVENPELFEQQRTFILRKVESSEHAR